MTPLIETRDALADLVRAIEPLTEEARLLTDRLIELDEEIARLEDWPGIECQWEPT